MIEQHYTPAVVAERLMMSEETVLRLCRKGLLRSFVVPGGRARRIPHSAVVEMTGEEQSAPDDRKVSGAVTELRRAG